MPSIAVALLLAATQLTADQQAQMLLAGARRAYNEKQLPFAAARFREFIQKHPGHRDLSSARYGLALCLLEGPAPDHDRALEQLQPIAADKAFAEHAFVLYYTGLARRGQGLRGGDGSRGRLEEASKQFAAAATAFTGRGQAGDLEWAARSRCDQAEMLLRLGKSKEARAAAAPLITDKRWRASRYAALAHYHHGLACFQLGDHTAAGRSLGQATVLTDETFGSHARYLVGRIHHLNTRQNEREEARLQYQAALRQHEAARKAAQERLRRPADAATRARLERLVKGPTPDHIARSTFFLGVLQYEDGRFADAQEHFKAFAAQATDATLAAEARLRQGFCQVRLRQFDDALKTLGPLAEKVPRLADQALYWTAKAQAGKADPTKPATFKAAFDTFRRAAQAAPPARRGDVLADLAETQLLARQPGEAAATYASILNDKLQPAREDEVLLHLATAQQLAGNYTESEKTCARFRDKHAASPLLPAVLFRQAENAALQAAASAAADAARHNDEAIKRYAVLVEKYPEYAHVHLARQALGTAYSRKGDLEKARQAFEAIPAAERQGELALVGYQLADVLIRSAPGRADDAVRAGRLQKAMQAAADLLDTFLRAAPASPHAPDALLKLGHCRGRLADVLAQPAERKQALAAARAAYHRLRTAFPKHDLVAQANFEHARVRASQGDVGGAIDELRRFTAAPLGGSAIAPLALLHLATLHRRQNQPAAAAAVLADCRKTHEEALRRDPARAAWVGLLRYHHAVALREADKLAEARPLFDDVARSFPATAEGWDSALRAGQCRKEVGEKRLADGRKRLGDASLKREQRQAAEKLVADTLQELRETAAYLGDQEAQLRKRKVEPDDQPTLIQTRARLLYELAWAWRAVADEETAAARRKLALERWQRRRDELAKQTPPGERPPVVLVPAVALAEVAVQPAETKALAAYAALIEAFPEVAANADARFELAELLATRGRHDEAVKLLQGALEAEKEPSAELADRIKVRLAACLLDRGSRRLTQGKAKVEAGRKDIEAAVDYLQTVTANPKSAALAEATYREAECLLHLGKSDEAIKLLARFRDHAPFRRIAGLTDRALLRLGFALGEKKQWEASRQAYQALVDGFGSSVWVHEAQYGVGWAHQNQGQYDSAIAAYARVTAGTASELAARAQLNVGVCRLAQKRHAEAATALLVVPFTYDYPELSALALLEAARAFVEDKQPAQAARLLRRVMRDHAGTAHAEAAKKRLADLGER